MNAPVVDKIFVYPIKSLDPLPVQSAHILSGGALEHDREFALFDAQGRVVNGKRDARIHRIRAEYEFPASLVTLASADTAGKRTFHLVDQQKEIEGWLGEFLGYRVILRRDTEVGFPDDLESPGPTVVSAGSLREVGSWFGWDSQETARHFRANLEIATEEPFWEDRLYSAAEATVEFQIGDVRILGVNPCQRCAVPSRDPATGSVLQNFQQMFSSKRESTLPAWADRSRFNHYYRFAVNTRIPPTEAGKRLSVGDPISFS